MDLRQFVGISRKTALKRAQRAPAPTGSGRHMICLHPRAEKVSEFLARHLPAVIVTCAAQRGITYGSVAP